VHPDLAKEFGGFFTIDDEMRACVIAVDRDLQPIGYLRWLAKVTYEQDFSAGVINMIYVNPAARRKGLGTALLEAATRNSDERGWSRPRHNTSRSTLGDKWAQATGAEPAEEIDELVVEGDPMSPQ